MAEVTDPNLLERIYEKWKTEQIDNDEGVIELDGKMYSYWWTASDFMIVKEYING